MNAYEDSFVGALVDAAPLDATRPAGRGLSDPIRAAETLIGLRDNLQREGLKVVVSGDFAELADLRPKYRGTPVSPMFNSDFCPELPTSAYWVGMYDSKGALCALQAFRLDQVYPNLADWVSGWMINLYLQRDELIIPKHNHRFTRSRTRTMKGPLVYHGEVWIDRRAANKGVFAEFMKYGLLTAHLKWQPNAVWALVGEYMITRGLVSKAGYDHAERGFLDWEWAPSYADEVEWVILADQVNLERLACETDLTQT